LNLFGLYKWIIPASDPSSGQLNCHILWLDWSVRCLSRLDSFISVVSLMMQERKYFMLAITSTLSKLMLCWVFLKYSLLLTC